MTLAPAVDAFVTLKRALGAVFTVDARILQSFVRAVGDIPVTAVTPAMCQAFCRGIGPPTRFWSRKHEALRGLFRYLVGRGHLQASLLPEPAPQIRSTFQRYIYSREDLQQLLTAANQPAPPHVHIRPATLRLVLLVLYATGMRAGEVLRLRRCDVDVRARLVAIWDTKFFKSRLVPIGAQLCSLLSDHARQRASVTSPDRDLSPFFATAAGQAIPLGRLEYAFARALHRTTIGRQHHGHAPRLHDLRATFAVHRLVAWYREGADVQARLPLLSTYLGHINVSATAVYLTMTVELLGEASRRFEQYAAPAEEPRHD
jgi:integrase